MSRLLVRVFEAYDRFCLGEHIIILASRRSRLLRLKRAITLAKLKNYSMKFMVSK